MANTVVWAEEWAIKLQERLSEPTKWKQVCRVTYTNTRVLHNPYLTEATVQSGTRGTAYTMQDVTETDESVTINTYKILPQIIDRADLAQSTFADQMVLADKQGILLNEAIESAFYGDYANLTTYDASEFGGSGNITVSATNIDDIVRHLKTKIRTAGGESLLEQYGAFIVWRPADLEILESFMQANGFQMADKALGSEAVGSNRGVEYMGVTHFSSNLLTAGHLVGGVKQQYNLGIVKDTYGQVMVNDKDPLNISGISVVSRVDFKGKAWHNIVPVLYNIVVA
jgi:hypothetical protein